MPWFKYNDLTTAKVILFFSIPLLTVVFDQIKITKLKTLRWVIFISTISETSFPLAWFWTSIFIFLLNKLEWQNDTSKTFLENVSNISITRNCLGLYYDLWKALDAISICKKEWIHNSAHFCSNFMKEIHSKRPKYGTTMKLQQFFVFKSFF